MGPPPSLRIVLADDDRQVLDALDELLGSTPGLEVVATATTAAAAMAACIEHEPDAVVLDVRMPGGGLSAARGVTETLPHTEVVVLTAHDTPELRSVAADAGVHAYLVKSQGEDVVRTLLRVAAHSSTADGGEARS